MSPQQIRQATSEQVETAFAEGRRNRVYVPDEIVTTIVRKVPAGTVLIVTNDSGSHRVESPVRR